MNVTSLSITSILLVACAAGCGSESSSNSTTSASANTTVDGTLTSSGGNASTSTDGGSSVTNAASTGSTTTSTGGGATGTTTTNNATTGGGASSTTTSATTDTSGGAGNGGASTTSTSTTGEGTTGGTVTLPEFVTSAENDYWNTNGTVTEVTSGADLNVDENTTYQRWDGFGGTFNEMGWDALSVVSSEITHALTLLFDAQDGANFVYGRIPLGASDYSMSWYTLAETADDYAMNDFSIARDQDMLIPYIKAAQQIRPDIRFFASPWVVPSWMMDGSRNMKNDAQTLEAHALYFAKFVEAYAAENIPIEAVHPQNEPGYARVHWTHPQFIDFIKSYLGPKFAELGITSEIWCGTMSAPEDGDIATTLANDAEAMQYVTGFGLQWNLEDIVSTLSPKGPVMQTEHRCGNYSFSAPYWDQSRYDPNKAQNDHLYGEESWQLIRDWIAAGVNSYVAWNMVLDTVGKSLDGWPQNALLVVDRSAQTLIVTPAYYVFRHYSQYIAPGATRIAISGSEDALAFKNPDGSIIVEVYNKGNAAWTTTVSVGGSMYQFDVPAHGWATFRAAS